VSSESPFERPPRLRPSESTEPIDWPSTVATDLTDDAPVPAADPTGRWRWLTRTAIAALVLLLGGAGFIAWPLRWMTNPDDSLQLVNGRMVGEASGYVVRVDREGQTIAISQSAFGWHPFVVAVNRETLITVQQREGGVGDLLEDVPVRVTYEVDAGRRLAKAIEIGSGRDAMPSTAARRPPPAPPVPAAHAVEAPGEPKRPDALSPVAPPLAAPAPAPPPTSAGAPVPPSAPPPPSIARPAPVEAPVSRPRPAASSTPAARGEAPRPSSEAASPDSARQGATDGDAADGTAAIDWLINSQRR